MHGLVRCKHERRCSRTRGEDVSFRDVTTETPDRNMTRGCEWRPGRKRGMRFVKSQLVDFCFGRRRLTFACSPRPGGRRHTWFGADGKVSIERWYLSPYVEKPYNSKVIKSFVPELRSRKCFLVFRDSYVRHEHSMYISHIRIINMLHWLTGWFSGMSIFFGLFTTMVNNFVTSNHIGSCKWFTNYRFKYLFVLLFNGVSTVKGF